MGSMCQRSTIAATLIENHPSGQLTCDGYAWETENRAAVSDVFG
jgi:hypothetical protein